MKRTRWKAAALGIGPALAALVIGACGSGEETTTTVQPPPVSATTADHLAKLSNRIATDLDDGLTCDAAYAADQLKDAVNHADLSATLRPGLEEVATSLVNEVNCPPPPPPPEPEKEDKKKEEEKKKDEGKNKEGDQAKGQHGDEGGDDGKPIPPGHGGVPPGQAKLKGEKR